MRSFYYTSVRGDEERLRTIRDALTGLGFTPVVFKKPQGQKAKGVDIQLTVDVLINAFDDNFVMCTLVAGDGDYVPIVKEVQRRGKLVTLAFFGDEKIGGLNPELKNACDAFVDLTHTLVGMNLEPLAEVPRV